MERTKFQIIVAGTKRARETLNWRKRMVSMCGLKGTSPARRDTMASIRLHYCGVQGNGEAQGLKSESRRTKKLEFLGGDVALPTSSKLPRWGSPSGVRRGEAPVINRFRTFYRLTKPLRVSVLLTLNFFQ